MSNPLSVRQPPPIPNDGPSSQAGVIEDVLRLFSESPARSMLVDALRERAEDGRRKYGTTLQPNNGRDPLIDALQESQDKAAYLKQALLEGSPVSLAYEMELASLIGSTEHWMSLRGVTWSGS